ncbi:hypothetical protein SmJEL517_g02775 [Synchytrium microbalum]|uniref:Doublecortin domain-containing protein n=1 Tax=Synchytrium microbalum TaxID=1806994 RepID=A0A507C5X0_9FUNG|nr:uncharacterized protein SmJEL517_g02775 [Synchytrium microbalum]TPX34748.1 hypothetical protein SmJEL517_g02775 [Synchytrium microbalum]
MAQVDEFHSRRVRVFKNGDVFSPGRRVVVSTRVYRNFEQFLQAASREVNLRTGAIRRIYTLDGRPVRSLSDFNDNGLYVAAGGEPFKSAAYPIQDDIFSYDQQQQGQQDGMPQGLPPIASNNAPHWVAVGGRVQGSTLKLKGYYTSAQQQQQFAKEEEKEVPIFTQTSKGYRVQILANGDSKLPAIKYVLNLRNCRSFDMLLLTVTLVMPVTHAPIRKIYDLETGKRVKNLQGLRDGQILVASSRDALKMVEYQISGPYNGSAMSSPVSPTSMNDNFYLSPSSDKTQAPRVCTFFPNGDSYHTGWTVAVKPSRFPSIRRLMEHLEHLSHDHVLRIYGTDGQRIRQVDELVHGHGYALAGDDPFIPVRYNVNKEKRATSSAGGVGLGGYSLHNPFMKVIKQNHQRSAESRQSLGVASKRTSTTTNPNSNNVVVNMVGAVRMGSAKPKSRAAAQQQQPQLPDAPAKAIKSMNETLARAAAMTKKNTVAPAAVVPHPDGIEEDALARYQDNNGQEDYGNDAPTQVLKSNGSPSSFGSVGSRHVKIQEMMQQDDNGDISGSADSINNNKSRAKSAKPGIRERMAQARTQPKRDAEDEDELDAEDQADDM